MFKLQKCHNWLIYKIINPQIREALKAFGCGTLVDIGCGEKPYAKMAAPYIMEHIGVDLRTTMHDRSSIDLFCTAYDTNLPNGKADTVLCTDVLEHLEEPDKAIKEVNRVLKKGGHAIYTVPLFWHLHEEPRDFYRYTKYGLKYLFEKNGFVIVELKPLSGFWITFGQELVYYLWRFRRGGKLNPFWWIIPAIGTLIQGVSYLLDKIDQSEAFTCEYLVVVRKK